MADSIDTARHYFVTKSNDLIQKSRFTLSAQQQKIILYLISHISPYDDEFKLYDFSINEFCKIAGLYTVSGGNYNALKMSIKALCDKSVWVTLQDGRETLLRWIEKPYIDTRSGVISIRLDRDMRPFLLRLRENYTKYELIYILRFDSKYSIRLYELLKSVHYHDLKPYSITYTVDELRQRLGAETYSEYRDLKRRVLEIALREINTYSDKDIEFTELRRGRSVQAVEFFIKSKPVDDRLRIVHHLQKELGATEPTLWERLHNQ